MKENKKKQSPLSAILTLMSLVYFYHDMR